MGHDHGHIKHNHNHSHGRQGNIKAAFFLNLTFTLLEIAGGFWTNSLAILSDALHDLGDSLSLGLAWYMEKYSEKGPDQKFSYGYARFSLLGALVNSVILIGGSFLILANSIPRLFKPEDINPGGMLVFAVFGIIINGLAVLRLRKGSSLNEKVVSWHLMEDVLGWAAILIAGIVLMFADIPVLDTILSVLITVYVLFNVVKNLKEVLNVFLQGVPKELSIDEIEREIVEAAGVLSAHHTHIWSLEGEKNLLSIHIVVKDETDRREVIEIKQKIRELMAQKGIQHVTIEIDFECEDCGNKTCE